MLTSVVVLVSLPFVTICYMEQYAFPFLSQYVGISVASGTAPPKMVDDRFNPRNQFDVCFFLGCGCKLLFDGFAKMPNIELVETSKLPPSGGRAVLDRWLRFYS